MNTPVLQPERVPFWKSRYGWTIIAFILAGAFISGLMVWQLMEVGPKTYCAIAESSSDNLRASCTTIIMKILDIKDHAIIGLLSILGMTVLSIVAVALGVKISAAGPGNTSVNIGAEETRMRNDDLDLTIPTPPSGR